MGEEAFTFDAGRVSLDLMATLRNRSAERLPDAAALDAWLLASGLAGAPRGAGAADLARARALRGALYAVIDADRPPAAAIATINAAAAAPVPPPQLALHGGGLRRERGVPSAAELIAEIARDAVGLLTGPQRALLRECEAGDCSGIYVDGSRGRTRRWCSTARCGNRARVAAHRARRHDAGR